MTLQKLVVDGADALRIKNALHGVVKIKRTLRGSKILNDQDHIKQLFDGRSFWVAEPSTRYTNDSEYLTRLTGDKVPSGFRQWTCRVSGSHMHYGQHRFIAEVVNYQVVNSCKGAIYVGVNFKITTVDEKVKEANRRV